MFIKTNEGYYIILHKDYLNISTSRDCFAVSNDQIINSIFNINVYDVVYNVNSAIENAYVIKKYKLLNDILQYINPIDMPSTYFNPHNIIHIDHNKIIFNDGTTYNISTDIYIYCSDSAKHSRKAGIVKYVRNKKLNDISNLI